MSVFGVVDIPGAMNYLKNFLYMKNTIITAAPHNVYLIREGTILIIHPITSATTIRVSILFFSEALVKFAIIILNKLKNW